MKTFRINIQLPALILASLFLLACEKSLDIDVLPQEVVQQDSLYYPDENWEEICCETSDGWSAEKLDEAYTYGQYLKSDAVVIIHKGRIVRRWGEYNRKFRVHSVRKSFLSALYGKYVDDGTLQLGATMEDLGIDDYQTDEEPSLTAAEKQATVQMLLQARSGVYHSAAYETAGMKERRPDRGAYAPGTHWYYNNWDFNALGTIFEQETGQGIYQAFKTDIADPIGMQHYNPETDGIYVSEDISMHKAYTFNMSAMDMARFGLLFARNGKWEGQQVIPQSWIEESTSSYSDAGTSGGYGYLWWVAVDGQHFSNMDDAPEGLFTARGNGGQVIAVVPEMDLVFVHRGNTYMGGDHGVNYREIGKLLMKVIAAMPAPVD